MRKHKFEEGKSTGDLIITVPWKTYVGHILQEEAIVEPLKITSNKQMYAEGDRLKAATPGDLDITAILDMFMAFKSKPYAQRRAQRLGRKDPKGDDRLSRAKDWEADYIIRDGRPADEFSDEDSEVSSGDDDGSEDDDE